MIINVLDKTGHTVLTDAPVKETKNVKEMSTKELKEEFDNLVKEGYMPIDDTTDKVMKGFVETKSVTMLYPVVGG